MDTDLQSDGREGVGVDINDLLETIAAIQSLLKPYRTAFLALVRILCWDSVPMSTASFAIAVWGSLVVPGLISGVFSLFLAATVAFSWTIPVKDPHSELIEFDASSQATADGHDWADEGDEGTTEFLGGYAEMLVALQSLLDVVFGVLVRLERLRRWVDPPESFRLLMGLVSLGTLLLHVPFNIVLCMLVVLTFSTSRMIREHWVHHAYQTAEQRSTDAQIRRNAAGGEEAWIYVEQNSKRIGGVDGDVLQASGCALPELLETGAPTEAKSCSDCSLRFNVFRKRVYCRACGAQLCSFCCSSKVPRVMFGATSPAAKKETVRVCKTCKEAFSTHDMARRLMHDTSFTETVVNGEELLI